MSDELFPTRLRKLREAKRINAKALGELCGLSKNMIGQYEKGEKMPSAKSLMALADFLDVSIDYLLGRDK